MTIAATAARLDLRLNSSDKSSISRAAELHGVPVAAFGLHDKAARFYRAYGFRDVSDLSSDVEGESLYLPLGKSAG